jgi:hypothetical protein
VVVGTTTGCQASLMAPTRWTKGRRLIAAGLYVLFIVLMTVAVGAGDWAIRLPAVVGAVAVVVEILVLALPLQRPADRQLRYPSGRQVVGWAAGTASALLAINLGRLWEGRLGLLVLGGALAALPGLAVVAWRVSRDTHADASDR